MVNMWTCNGDSPAVLQNKLRCLNSYRIYQNKFYSINVKVRAYHYRKLIMMDDSFFLDIKFDFKKTNFVSHRRNWAISCAYVSNFNRDNNLCYIIYF